MRDGQPPEGPPSTRWAVAAVVAAAFALRLYGAARARLTFDEAIVWAFAREIGLLPLRLVARSADHPALGAYVVRLSAAVFGESDLGLRLLDVSLGAATVLVVYRLGAALWDRAAGLAAAALLAADQFHASWSRLAGEEAVVLFAATVSMLLLWRGLERGGVRDWVLAGVATGLACLAKETALLLFPVFGLFLLGGERGRRALRTGAPWTALAAALGLLGADAIANRGRLEWSHWGRDVRLLGAPPAPTPRGTSLYLGELYQVVIDPGVLDADYHEGRAYAAYWPVGAVYLSCGLLALVRFRDPATRLAGAAFAVPLLFFSLLGGPGFDPFWWASLSLVPAVLLTGRTLARAQLGRPWIRPALMLAIVAAGLHTTWRLGKAGTAAPRLGRQEWARRIAADGEARLGRGDAATAWEQGHQSVLMAPEEAAGHLLLGRLSWLAGDTGRARRHVERALALDPSSDAARRLREALAVPAAPE